MKQLHGEHWQSFATARDGYVRNTSAETLSNYAAAAGKILANGTALDRSELLSDLKSRAQSDAAFQPLLALSQAHQSIRSELAAARKEASSRSRMNDRPDF